MYCNIKYQNDHPSSLEIGLVTFCYVVVQSCTSDQACRKIDTENISNIQREGEEPTVLKVCGSPTNPPPSSPRRPWVLPST